MAALIVISCGSCSSKDEIKPLTEGGSMKLTSTAFADGEKMPQEFAKLGANHIPPLEIDGVPEGTKSLAIIVYDPDAPLPGGFHLGSGRSDARLVLFPACHFDAPLS